MLTSELDFNLPERLIAQRPLTPRDSSRLLAYDRLSGRITHRRLTELPGLLGPGDLLVFNDSRVIKARVLAVKPTGGRVELLLLKRRQARIWEALVKPSARLKPGMVVTAGGPETTAGDSGYPFVLQDRLGGGRWLIANASRAATADVLEQAGETPLPPYIKEKLTDPERYQTVYAARPGSAAAPTAGLHFTLKLINDIKAAGAAMAPVTLHIGLDTFRPVGEANLARHQIHREYYRVPRETYEQALAARNRGGRVIAVGTTSARVLETVFGPEPAALEGETGLFITPGFKFRSVDGLLTNFHLPRSTLLAMVMAFAGVDQTRRLYREAVAREYRFFSFGDAMLAL